MRQMHGRDPDGKLRLFNSAEERFWSKVDVKGEDDCWIWKASTVKGRYGKFKYERVTYPAHRFAWIITNGLISDDVQVLHKCNNSLCVNPSHLALGQQLENMRDKKKRMIDRYSKETVIKTVLSLLQDDPHTWDRGECDTCKVISTIVGEYFGCYAPPPRGQS